MSDASIENSRLIQAERSLILKFSSSWLAPGCSRDLGSGVLLLFFGDVRSGSTKRVASAVGDGALRMGVFGLSSSGEELMERIEWICVNSRGEAGIHFVTYRRAHSSYV